ncbi:phytanoyl-CoA dioxygenase family protein [Candidatus Poribacteria bacterium]|nr:phytanoyl-CoA dioxygenase family protein [Candidatus Poribacteria bacterium]
MNTQVTSDQIEFYRENGFLVIDDFLKGSELSSWQDAVDAAVAQFMKRDDMYHNQKGRESYYGNVFVQCVNLWKTSEKVKELILAPELGRMAADLAGTSGVRLYHDHAMFKQPWANPTNFHVDNPYDPFYSHQAIMFWVALDDATAQNGCLYFLPGTHKTSGFEVGGSLGEVGIGELFREYPEWAEIEPYPAEMKAGDGVFISGMVAHAAGPNMTTHPRRAFAMLFMPEDATFNGKKSALPDEVFAKLKTGDVLADDAHLPLVFSYQDSG